MYYMVREFKLCLKNICRNMDQCPFYSHSLHCQYSSFISKVINGIIEFLFLLQLRPPQPAVYIFLLDTSRMAVESGYLNIVCKEISAHLDNLPGDTRTQVGVICYNSYVHFYNMAEGLTRPHEITVLDIKGK